MGGRVGDRGPMDCVYVCVLTNHAHVGGKNERGVKNVGTGGVPLHTLKIVDDTPCCFGVGSIHTPKHGRSFVRSFQ
jgi:hypothetical protein